MKRGSLRLYAGIHPIERADAGRDWRVACDACRFAAGPVGTLVEAQRLAWDHDRQHWTRADRARVRRAARRRGAAG